MIENSIGDEPETTGDSPRVRNVVSGGVDGNVAQTDHVDTIHVTVRHPRLVTPHLLPAVPPSWPSPDPADLDEMTARMHEGHQVMVLGGPPRVGKSALALGWAHRHLDRWPDGQFCANGGMDPITKQHVAPNDVLRDWLLWLGQYSIPDKLAERAALWRNCVGNRRVLLMVDDVRYAALVKWLLPGGPNWLMLVTAPQPLVSLVASGAANVLVGRTKHSDDPVWR